jgi:hypothetical protein
MGVSYNKKNMEEASSYFKPSQGQKDMEDGLSNAWNKVKGLVGAGEDGDAMSESLKKRAKKYED